MNINVGSSGSWHLVSGYIGSTSVYIPNTYTSLCVCVCVCAKGRWALCEVSNFWGFLGLIFICGTLVGSFFMYAFWFGFKYAWVYVCACVCVSASWTSCSLCLQTYAFIGKLLRLALKCSRQVKGITHCAYAACAGFKLLKLAIAAASCVCSCVCCCAYFLWDYFCQCTQTVSNPFLALLDSFRGFHKSGKKKKQLSKPFGQQHSCPVVVIHINRSATTFD